MTGSPDTALAVGVLLGVALLTPALVIALGGWRGARRQVARERRTVAAARATVRAAHRRAMDVDALSMDRQQLAACSGELLRRADLPTDLDHLPPEEETC